MEVHFIHQRLSLQRGRDREFNDQLVLKAIRKILSHFREANLDVPFVAMNRSYDFKSEGLTERDVWTIATLDQEYAKYRAQYLSLKN